MNRYKTTIYVYADDISKAMHELDALNWASVYRTPYNRKCPVSADIRKIELHGKDVALHA